MIRMREKQSGFSMIELAIAMTLVGLALSSALVSYNEYTRTKTANDTQEKKTAIEYALSRFIATNGRMPCPADPTLPLSSASAGVENCLASVTGLGCSGAGGTGVCRVNGGRDTAADITDTNPDPVLIGAVPYVALGISGTDTLDSWGGRMTYAVSQFLTPVNSFNEDYGVLGKELYSKTTSAYENAANPNVTDGSTPLVNSFSYALVSHGPDNKGAYNYNGILLRPCDTTATSADAENCDGDAVFRAATRKSTADNADYYDDAFLSMGLIRDSDKWQYTGDPGEIRSKQAGGGYVGIGKWNPTQPLDVAGNMLIEDMRAQTYCNNSAANCFEPKLIGGVGDDCDGGTLNGIRSNAAACNSKINLGAVPTQTCPAGQKVRGFTAGGVLVCAN